MVPLNLTELDASSLFNGQKKIVFTTSNLIGGRNTTMFLAFLTLSVLLLFAMMLTLIVFKREKKLRAVLTGQPTISHEINSSLNDSENFNLENSPVTNSNPKEPPGF